MFHRSGIIAALAALAAISLTKTAVAAESKPIPIVDFVRSSEFGAPSLSPDGKHLAMRVRLAQKEGEDEYVLTIYDLTALKPLSTMRMQKYEMPAAIHWVSDTRVVVEMAKDLGWLEIPAWTGELLATNIDGTKQEYLYGYQMFIRSNKGYSGRNDRGYGYVESIPLKRNGRFFMREVKWDDTSKRTFLYDINAVNGERKLVTEVVMPGFDFLLQRNDQPRFAFGLDDENEYVLKRLDKDGEWADVKRRTPKELLAPVSFAADDKSFYAQLSTAGEPYALVRESVESGERKVLARDPFGDVTEFQSGARPRVPFAASTRIGVPAFTYIDDAGEDAKLHKLLAKSFPGQVVHFKSFSDDGSKIILFVASDRNPGDYYLMDRATGKAEHLFSTRPWIDPDRMAERRPIAFKARSGTMLHGYLTLPPGKADKNLPMILLPHGGPIGIADEWYYDDDAQFLASRGYAVLQVNYRGSGGRGPAFRDDGYGQYGTGIQEDMIDGVRWAVEQGTADAARICVYGASFGGYSAMMAVVRAPGLFKCAAGLAGVYDLPMIFAQDSTRRYKGTYNFFKKALGENKADLEGNSPARLADKINVPVFLAHGEQDETALPEQAEAMHAALNRAGKKHEWMMVPKEGHGFYAEKNRIAFYEKLEAFFAKHIGK